ncbi:MAG: arylsulfatase [Bacteroidota bacterium]
MRAIIFSSVLIGSIILSGCTEKVQEEKPINVIMILTDDQGYGDIGFHGNPWIQTPNLDKLAAESIRFTNFHVGTTCAPTRAGLMSGTHCNRTGTWHTILGRSFLSTRFKTLPTYLTEASYHTGIFGKWHLGDNYPFRPQDRGFQEVLIHGGGGVGQTPDYWGNDYFDDTYWRNGEAESFKGYCTDVWFENAISYIDAQANAENPFFCYISTNAPHGPHHVPQPYIDMYADNQDVPHPAFYGQITNLDDNIGKLMSYLEEEELLENTLLLFLTDNGTSQGAKLDKDQRVIKGYNAGMRGKKVSQYEGGHRVPLFMRLPASIKAAKTEFDELTSYTDILPTILDFLQLSPKETIDGTSLKELIERGEQSELEGRILITDTQREEWVEKWKRTSVMQDNWRLVNDEELYDIFQDPGQTENLIEQYPQKAEELSSFYEQWWLDLQADLEYENRIVIGNEAEPTTLLTAHDWHAEEIPPWHQNMIRKGNVANGYWSLDIQQAGEYHISLYRWPPYTQLAIADTLAMGEEVPGGKPFERGVAISVDKAEVVISGKSFPLTLNESQTAFEGSMSFEKGPLDLSSIMTSPDGTQRGAYFVEIHWGKEE